MLTRLDSLTFVLVVYLTHELGIVGAVWCAVNGTHRPPTSQLSSPINLA